MASASEIRTAFLEYFARHGHELVPSGPLVPRNDPTLMFTNAGMVQFKGPVHSGADPRGYTRARPRRSAACAPAASTTISTTWASPRATRRFFEMLGNFSFGDYFKDRRHRAMPGT